MTKLTKTKFATIALILLLTITTTLATLPTSAAQGYHYEKTTRAYISSSPNPIGVGQSALLFVGIYDPLQTVWNGWTGLTVTVEKPDGTIITLGPFKTEATGGLGTRFVPDQVGTYHLQTHFPAQNFTWSATPLPTLYKASDSPIYDLVVQEEPIETFPGFPLPTEYWTRPINSQMWEWRSISGNWLEHWSYLPHDQSVRIASGNDDAPDTGHVLWAKPLIMGGLVGAEFENYAFEDGDAYEGKGLPPIIIGGVLYYNQFQALGGVGPEREVVAVNLRTGEEQWRRPLVDPDGISRDLSFGQIFYWDSYNYHGAFGYLWANAGSTWHAFDPSTGRYVYSMTNVPSGSRVHGPKGEIFIYSINLAAGWMSMWNSSRVVSLEGSWLRNNVGNTFSATSGIEWNVTIPLGLKGRVSAVLDDRLLLMTDNRWSINLYVVAGDFDVRMAALSTKPGQEGTLLFNRTWTPPSGHEDVAFSYRTASLEEGIFVGVLKATTTLVGFDINTGAQLWLSEPLDPFDAFAIHVDRRSVNVIAEGKVFAGATGGVVQAVDAKTGVLVWSHTVKDPYAEMYWGPNWPVYLSFVTDGKIYVHHTDHSSVNPKPRGAPFTAIDIETGEEVFSINIRGHHWGAYPVIGDSIIAMYNTYDQRFYAMGKGPSATEISAPEAIQPIDFPVLLKGFVTDISPGVEEYAVTARFPKGIPAVSDANMSDWMEYVYMQTPRPKDVTGVEVTLSVIDENGNYRDIGTTTSNADGFFTLSWQPDIEGLYTVYASFAGSESYWPSHAVTSFVVGNAVATPAPTAAPQASVSDMYFVPAVSGIIVAIIVGFVVLFLALRKRP